MAPPDDEFLTLCTRALSGEASPAERERLEARLEDAECRRYYRELRTQWEACREEPGTEFDPQRAYARLAVRLEADSSPAAEDRAEGNVVPFPARLGRRWAGFAAAAAALALGASLWLGAPAPSPERAPWSERAARAGERPLIVLPDGSRVTLNGRSALAFPAAFGAERRVRLRGEAFFEVAPDAARPFVVEAGSLRTTVHGTQFNVSTQSLDGRESVALVEGSVEVAHTDAEHPTAPVWLRPGQQFIMDPGTHRARVVEFDRQVVTGWLAGVLAFRDERLARVADRLARRFDVVVEIPDPAVADKTISARFENEDLREILEVLAFAGGFRFELGPEAERPRRVRLSALPARSR